MNKYLWRHLKGISRRSQVLTRQSEQLFTRTQELMVEAEVLLWQFSRDESDQHEDIAHNGRSPQSAKAHHPVARSLTGAKPSRQRSIKRKKIR